jgi:hypothetical protein
LNELRSRNPEVKKENRDANKLFKVADYEEVAKAEDWKVNSGDSITIQILKKVCQTIHIFLLKTLSIFSFRKKIMI